MSARSETLEGIDPEGRAWLASYLNVFAKKHAHELAEKQRAAAAEWGYDFPGFAEAVSDLTNLIDPEAQSERRRCGWEQAHESHRWIQNGVWYLCSTVVLNSE